VQAPRSRWPITVLCANGVTQAQIATLTGIPQGRLSEYKTPKRAQTATATLIASAISRKLASAYSLFQLPPVTVSCSHEHSAWRGTVSISSSTLHSVIDDIYRSITDAGLSSLAIVNCHGGNYSLANVVQEGNAMARKWHSSRLGGTGRMPGNQQGSPRRTTRICTPASSRLRSFSMRTLALVISGGMAQAGYRPCCRQCQSCQPARRQLTSNSLPSGSFIPTA
jgi:Creatinine amidohydrolase